jgi:hypothetical protein
MRTLLAGLIAVTSLAAVRPADAQPPAAARTASYPEIVALLESDRPADQAWGARLAGQSIWTETRPLIEQIVVRHSAGQSAEDTFCVEAALDGLIGLGLPPSPDLLAAVWRRWPTETLILAARLRGFGDGKSADRVLLSLLSNGHDLVWFGAANLLLNSRPLGFVAALLKDLRLQITLFISKTGNELECCEGTLIADGIQIAERPPDYPPATRYDLFASAGADVRVVAVGPVSVYRTRIEARGGHLPLPESGQPVTGRDRVEYAAAAGHVQHPPLTGDEVQSVTWRGAAALEADKRWVRRDVMRRYKDFLGLLQNADVLSRSEAAALSAPPVDIVVKDLRRPVR